MSEHNLDVFLTHSVNLESALSCLENENLFNEKIKVLEKNIRCFSRANSRNKNGIFDNSG